MMRLEIYPEIWDRDPAEDDTIGYLTGAPTVAQRIVRAKMKIRAAGIPYQVPARAELPDRLATVLHVVYLVFNEGYSASAGESVTRVDLSTEAIRLGRLLVELLPAPTEPEALGLLALMLLHELRADPSPIVALNRAAAVAMRHGPAAGLALIDAIFERGDLSDYHLADSARADLCRRLGRTVEARAAYQRALKLARQAPERRFLERRLGEVAAE